MFQFLLFIGPLFYKFYKFYKFNGKCLWYSVSSQNKFIVLLNKFYLEVIVDVNCVSISFCFISMVSVYCFHIVLSRELLRQHRLFHFLLCFPWHQLSKLIFWEAHLLYFVRLSFLLYSNVNFDFWFLYHIIYIL